MPKKIKPKFKLTLKEKAEFVFKRMDSYVEQHFPEVEIDEKFQAFKESLLPYFLGEKSTNFIDSLPDVRSCPNHLYMRESVWQRTPFRLKDVGGVRYDYLQSERGANNNFRHSLNRVKSVGDLTDVAGNAVYYYAKKEAYEKSKQE